MPSLALLSRSAGSRRSSTSYLSGSEALHACCAARVNTCKIVVATNLYIACAPLVELCISCMQTVAACCRSS
jgi:hypothetical protein